MARSKNSTETFGGWLKRTLETNGISKSSLAEESGISSTSIGNIIEEKHRARPATQDSIRAAIQVLTTQSSVAFGQWVRDVRLKKKISVQELAAKAKISLPALYNIENGKTQNPNAKTREKIESALGQSPSIEIQSRVDDVVGLGQLEGFDPYETNLIPDTPGVYVLYDVSERPIYVGRSKNINKRIKQHHTAFWFKRPIISTGSYIIIKDNTLRNQIEEILIKFLKSNAVINKVYVDRDLEDN